MVEVKNADKAGRLLEFTLLEQLDHGLLVSYLATSLAKRLGLDETDIQELAMAGLLHDIGKIRLSRYVESGNAMTVEEIKYVRMHSMFGSQILQQQGFSKQIQEMVLYHHENYDGSGYPNNLQGDTIPLGARILRVCDVFAALLSDRPYRKGFDQQTAMFLLIEEHKNFDMRVFLAFQRMIHEEEIPPVAWLEKLPAVEKQELLEDLLFPVNE